MHIYQYYCSPSHSVEWSLGTVGQPATTFPRLPCTEMWVDLGLTVGCEQMWCGLTFHWLFGPRQLHVDDVVVGGAARRMKPESHVKNNLQWTRNMCLDCLISQKKISAVLTEVTKIWRLICQVLILPYLRQYSIHTSPQIFHLFLVFGFLYSVFLSSL